MFGPLYCGFSFIKKADIKLQIWVFLSLPSPIQVTWLNYSIICYTKDFNFLFWWQSKFLVKFQFGCRFLEEKQHT